MSYKLVAHPQVPRNALCLRPLLAHPARSGCSQNIQADVLVVVEHGVLLEASVAAKPVLLSPRRAHIFPLTSRPPPALPAMSFERVPQEIRDMIIDFLHEDKQSLRECSRISCRNALCWMERAMHFWVEIVMTSSSLFQIRDCRIVPQGLQIYNTTY